MLYHGQIRLRGKGHLSSGRRKWIDRLPGNNRVEKRICLVLCSGIALLIAVMIWAVFFMHGS